MKRNIIVFVLGALCTWLPAQTPVVQIEDNGSSLTLEHMLDSVFRLVDLTQVSSGILAERGFQFTRLDWYDGQIYPYNQLKYETWYGLYGSMYSGAVDTSNRLPPAATE